MTGDGRMRIGDALIASGAVSEDQLRRALAEQRTTGRRVGELLVEQGIVTPGALVQALATVQGVPGCRRPTSHSRARGGAGAAVRRTAPSGSTGGW